MRLRPGILDEMLLKDVLGFTAGCGTTETFQLVLLPLEVLDVKELYFGVRVVS